MTANKPIEVIIIEDNNLFRRTLSGFINQNKYIHCTGSFGSCEDALKSLKNGKLNPEIILLDIGLPGMSGVEGISHFKSAAPGSKIIMLTIQDDDENIFKSICAGASGYLLKDSDSEKIITAINDVLQGGSPMNAFVAAKVLDMFRNFVPAENDYNLTKREKEILSLLVEGMSKKQIGASLFISYHTIDSHIRNIYEKLEVHSSSGAVAKALKENLI